MPNVVYGPRGEPLTEVTTKEFLAGIEPVSVPEPFSDRPPVEEQPFELPEEEPEEPEFIEEQGEVIRPSGKSIEELKRERLQAAKKTRAQRLEEKIEVARKKGVLSREEQEIRRYGGMPYQRVERGLKTAGGIARKIGTLGGPLGKPSRDYYIPRASKEAYVPTGMRYLTSMKQGTGQPLKAAGTPSLERLRTQTDPKSFRFGLPVQEKAVGMGGLNLNQSLSRLKSLGTPKGLSPIEQIVARQAIGAKSVSPIQQVILGQIQSSPEIDTRESIIGAMQTVGVPRERTEQELGGLVQSGIVRQQRGGYEIA